jgi:hypothetical protein
VPVFDAAAWCLINGSGVYVVLAALNLILAFIFSLVQSLHEIDLDFS